MLLFGPALLTTDEEHIEQVMTFLDIEALECTVAQCQRCGVGLELPFIVGMSQHILQSVSLLLQLSFGVELEDIEIIIIPVIYTILERYAVLFIPRPVNADCHILALTGCIHVEVAADGYCLTCTRMIANLYDIAACGALSVVDAETEQTMVAHGPELSLLLLVLPLLRGEHLHHFVHFHKISVHVGVLHFMPHQRRSGIFYLGKVSDITDVIGKVQLKVLRLNRSSPTEEKEQGEQEVPHHSGTLEI